MCVCGIANLMCGFDMDDPTEAQIGAAGGSGYDVASIEGKRILDNLAA